MMKGFFVQTILYISLRDSLNSKTSRCNLSAISFLLLTFKGVLKIHSETAVIFYVPCNNSKQYFQNHITIQSSTFLALI